MSRKQSPNAIGDESRPSHLARNGSPLHVQSIVLDKLLEDPNMQEVVVMEVSFKLDLFILISSLFFCDRIFSTRNRHPKSFFVNFAQKLRRTVPASFLIGWLYFSATCC